MLRGISNFVMEITYDLRIFGVTGKNYLNYLWCLQSTTGKIFGFKLPMIWESSGS